MKNKKEEVLTLEPTNSPLLKLLEGKKPVHIPELEFNMGVFKEELIPITEKEASRLLRVGIALARKLGWIPEDENSKGS